MKKILLILMFLALFFASVFANTISIDYVGVIDGNYYNTNNIDINFIVSNLDDMNYFIYNLNNSDFDVVKEKADFIGHPDQNILKVELTNLPVGKNELVFDANYHDGNFVGETKIEFFVDTIQPDIIGFSTTSGTNYSNKKEPVFNLDLNKSSHYFGSGKIWLSCNDANWDFFEIDWSGQSNIVSFTGFDVTTGEGCNPNDGNKTIFVKITDNLDRNSSVRSTNYYYDGTKPTPPKNFSVSAGNNEATLSWGAPDSDQGGSGNKEYRIYWIKPNSDWERHSIITPVTTTNRVITGLTNGLQYSFRMTTVDNAGNESTYTDVKTITPRAESCGCDLIVRKNNVSVSYVKNGDLVSVRCNIEKISDNVRIRYRYNTNSFTDLTSPRDNTDRVEAEHSIISGYNTIEFACVWTYSGTNFEENKTIIIDNVSPEIVWDNIERELSGTEKISAIVTDNVIVSRVDFELNGTTYGSTKSGNEYYFNLDTTRLENGSYNIRVIAIDGAGNETRKNMDVVIENLLTDAQKRVRIVSDTQNKKIVVDDLIKYYSDRGLRVSEEALLEKDLADELLLEATTVVSDAIAISKAEQAKTIYDNFNQQTTFVLVDSNVFVFDKENSRIVFSNMGLVGEQLEQAQKNLLEQDFERKLSIIRVGDQYNALIELSFDFNGDYKIIEVIPKEFVDTATKIFSNTEFNIIEDNPIIEFVVSKDDKKIFYSVLVSEEDANRIIGEGIINDFSPPIILNIGEEIVFSRGDNSILLIALILLVLIIIVVGTIFFLQQNKNNFGKDNPIEKVKQKLFEPKPKKKNWKYKG